MPASDVLKFLGIDPSQVQSLDIEAQYAQTMAGTLRLDEIVDGKRTTLREVPAHSSRAFHLQLFLSPRDAVRQTRNLNFLVGTSAATISAQHTFDVPTGASPNECQLSTNLAQLLDYTIGAHRFVVSFVARSLDAAQR